MTLPAGDLAGLLKRLEEELLRPEVRRSRSELEARLAPDFVEVGSSGRLYDRQAAVAALAAEPATGDRAATRIDDFAVTLLAPGVALATYRSVREEPAGGSPASARRASIWRRDGGSWRMVFHQGTPVV